MTPEDYWLENTQEVHDFYKSFYKQNYKKSVGTLHIITLNTVLQVPRGHQRFPYQHEAVRLAHEGLPRSNSTGKEAYALVIRTRPDVLLFKTLSLGTVEEQLRSEAKSALLCDLPSAATGRLVSPWDLCNKIALRDLCRRE